MIRSCTVEDLSQLCQLARQTFYDTFSHLNTPANMQAYLEQAFNESQLGSELSDQFANFYFLYIDGELAGYMKLNQPSVQTDLNEPDSLELERIYVSRSHQGQGFGQMLLDRALETARQQGKSCLWLGVWEKNASAREFYTRNGFYASGTHSFVMGDEIQNDLIMRRDLCNKILPKEARQ